jgi:hypothetical protein
VVRRKYLENGTLPTSTYDFPLILVGEINGRFNPAWCGEYVSSIEYSESNDKSYYFCCFLFRAAIRKGLVMTHLLLKVGIVEAKKLD